MSADQSMRIAVALAREILKGREARLCGACAGILAVSGAGISIMSEQHSGRMCVSNTRMEALEELQFTLGEGPCQDAYAAGAPIVVPDFGPHASARWPAFVAEAVAVGVQSVFAYPLQNQGATVGVLTLYQDTPGAMSPTRSEECLAVADVLAQTLISLIKCSPPGTLPAGLDDAVTHRAEVHQAAGMVSVQLGVSVAAALVVLRAHAYAHGQAVSVVAADIVARRLRLDDREKDK